MSRRRTAAETVYAEKDAVGAQEGKTRAEAEAAPPLDPSTAVTLATPPVPGPMAADDYEFRQGDASPKELGERILDKLDEATRGLGLDPEAVGEVHVIPGPDEPTLDLRFEPPLDGSLASGVALEMAGPLPSTPAGRVHAALMASGADELVYEHRNEDQDILALQVSSALLRLRQLEERCHTGGDVGLADIRQLIAILEPPR